MECPGITAEAPGIYNTLLVFLKNTFWQGTTQHTHLEASTQNVPNAA